MFRYFVGGLALSGFSLSVLPFATSYKMVSFWCGLFGLASGTYVGITAVIMADLLVIVNLLHICL